MYCGRFVHSLDKKGRVSLPAGIRMQLQEQCGDKAPFITNVKNSLALWPHQDFLDYASGLSSESQLDPDVQNLQRFLISGAQECPIDGQGRITIPQYLREHAQLDREVTIAGVGPKIEIWDKARFDQDVSKTHARFDEISSVVARSGS